MATDFIPKQDHLFLEWLTVVVNYLKNKFPYWNIPESAQQNVEQLLANFAIAFGLAEDPQTRTKAAVTAKRETRLAAETGIRAYLRAFVTNNPLVTDEDRNNMALPIHKTTHTHVPAPTRYPFFTVDSSVLRRLTIDFFDQSATRKAKPEGVHGAEIRWAVLDTPVLHLKDLTNSSFDTRTPFTLEFDEELRGKTVYFCLCWENPTGEKGPWSEIVSAIIP
jgi:hypothetical protein